MKDMKLRCFLPAMLLLITTSAAFGGKETYVNPDGYAYYNNWWMEYMSDKQTALLLHFNQPDSPKWARPANRKIATKKKAEQPNDFGLSENLLSDIDVDNGTPGNLSSIDENLDKQKKTEIEKLEKAEGRYRDAKAPEGVIYDYSSNRKEIRIPKNTQKIKGGRFGKALKFNGKNGIRTVIGKRGGAHTMEGWFKVSALPNETVCLLASADDGPRLLLQSTGHLKVINLPEDETEYPTSMRTDQPISLDEWVHIACYTWIAKHIEYVGNAEISSRDHWRRIGVNGRVAAEIRAQRIVAGFRGPQDLIQRGPFYVGMNPNGKQVFNGLVDEVRVAGYRRYNKRPSSPWRDLSATREIPFGPPHFQKDARVFHADFESREMLVHPEGNSTIKWDLGKHADFSDYQRDGIYGKGLLIDPAMGLPRIPIQGFSPKDGTFEFWLQPVNWDNHTDFAKISWGKHTMTLARFMGRDTKTGEIVPFMTFRFPRATIHGISDWIHPGTWFHLIWTWSPEDVYKKDGVWGDNPPKKGDPLALFRAKCEGETIYKAIMKRNTKRLDRIEPLYLEIGISDDITVYQGQRPAILIDEVIGHNRSFSEEEIDKAPKRWKGRLSIESE